MCPPLALSINGSNTVKEPQTLMLVPGKSEEVVCKWHFSTITSLMTLYHDRSIGKQEHFVSPQGVEGWQWDYVTLSLSRDPTQPGCLLHREKRAVPPTDTQSPAGSWNKQRRHWGKHTGKHGGTEPYCSPAPLDYGPSRQLMAAAQSSHRGGRCGGSFPSAAAPPSATTPFLPPLCKRSLYRRHSLCTGLESIWISEFNEIQTIHWNWIWIGHTPREAEFELNLS